MFRIAFMIEDKHVANMLHTVAGVAIDLQVVPVVNVGRVANGKATPATNGDPIELFIAMMKKRKLTSVNAKSAKDLMQEIGLARTSYYYVIKRAMAAHLLKKTGSLQKTEYHLIPPKGDK